MNDSRESYSGVIPTKQPNKSGRPLAEAVEGRPMTKENVGQSNPNWTPSQRNGSSGLDRVREAAKKDGKLRFTALLHHVTIDLLRELPQPEEKGCTGNGRGDLGRIWKRTGGKSEQPPRANPSWSLSSATVTKSLDSEKRWKATTIGNRGIGR
jgi:hypothetical protein